MNEQRRFGRKAQVAVGYAADGTGSGVACARVVEGAWERSLRVPFAVRRLPALLGRDVAYAALTAVADEVRRSGVVEAEFMIDDERVAADVSQRRTLPGPLAMPYVRLRCTLNRFRLAAIHAASNPVTRDLAEAARTELGLLVAA
jgi:hypothetical protein